MTYKKNGFSLVEALVVVAVVGFVMASIFLAIIHFRDVTAMEQARVRQAQDSRFLHSGFTSEVQNAGAVLTISNNFGMLRAPSLFTGLFPLNNTNFSDGLIVASGDPTMICKLAQPSMGSNGTFTVKNTNPDAQFSAGDIAILLGQDGYVVFRVAGHVGTSLQVSTTYVYYSGLLNTTEYTDPATDSAVGGQIGTSVNYPENAPIMRLTSFSIYLLKKRYDAKRKHDVRDLIRVTDCKGMADVLNSDIVEKAVMAENVWDMQIVYTVYPHFPLTNDPIHYYKNGTGGSTNLKDLLISMNTKNFKEVTIYAVTMTDEFAGRGKTEQADLKIKAVADRPIQDLPVGKYGFKEYSFVLYPKNFGVVL